MRIKRTKRLYHPADALIDMVADVKAYPKFINFISAVRILSREDGGPFSDVFVADVVVQYKMFSETFRSRVTVDRENRQIRIEKAGHGGAVRRLNNIWDFKSLSDGSTQLDFVVDVDLKAAPLQFLLKSKIDKAARNIMAAFERRAKQICPNAGDADKDLHVV